MDKIMNMELKIYLYILLFVAITIVLFLLKKKNQKYLANNSNKYFKFWKAMNKFIAEIRKESAARRLAFTLKDESGYVDGRGFQDSELTDDDLSNVPEDTVFLDLDNAKITDEGIFRLPHLKSLRCIDLDSTQITDKSMEVISTFEALEEVWIENTKITDKGFKKLTLLPNLRYVSFWDTKISDVAFNYVMERCPNLEFEG
jgi:hypothetical protein